MRASDVAAGAVVRQARRSAGLTQPKVATRAGVQQGMVSAHESTPVGRRLSRRRTAVLAVATLRGMTELRVFGSVARGEGTNASDLDLLVRVPEGTGLLSPAPSPLSMG